VLEECHVLLFLQEMDLEVREAILAEEQEHDLHPIDGQDLLAELDKTHECMDKINDERVIEA
jgi:hypothetical protein